MLPWFVFTSGMLTAQNSEPVFAGYAYRQPVLGGAKITTVAVEDGTEKQLIPSNKGNLFIYLEYKKSQFIVPYRIWIAGQPFRVEYQKLPVTPIVLNNAGIGFNTNTDTLVKKTSNKIIQVSPSAALSGLVLKPVPGVEENAVPGKIVVEYYWRAKRYCYIIGDIKNLEPIPLQ